jgi:two-component system sensor histidine kinase CreC
VVIRGEEFLLEHAIRNLLENAIDFSPVGARIVVRLSTADGHVVISVEDSGPGIPDYAQQRVFDRFYSLHRPGSERKSTGLGLSLVKEVAELHGGSASIYNRASGGACAQISLPFTPNS